MDDNLPRGCLAWLLMSVKTISLRKTVERVLSRTVSSKGDARDPAPPLSSLAALSRKDSSWDGRGLGSVISQSVMGSCCCVKPQPVSLAEFLSLPCRGRSSMIAATITGGATALHGLQVHLSVKKMLC